MTRLDKIIIPIAGDLLQYEKEFKAALDSEVKLINSVSNYLIKNKGKSFRPILTLLCSRLCSQPTINTYKAAAMMEALSVES